MILDPLLARLEESQLLRRDPDPEPAFLFKNALTQETAYRSLLVKRRREIHRMVAKAYEALYADRLDEYSPLLAQHYGEAGDDEKTLDYAQQAGNRAARVYANAEAVMYYRQALTLAVHSGAPSPRLVELHLCLGRTLELSTDYDGALGVYRALEDLGSVRRDTTLVLPALIARTTVHSTPTARFDPNLARSLSVRALDLARQLGNRPAEAKILWNLALLSYFVNEHQAGIRYGEESLAIARELGLQEQLGYTLTDLQRLYLALGRFDQAREAGNEARMIWRRMGNLPMLADALASESEGVAYQGEADRAMRLVQEALTINRQIGNLWGQSHAHMLLGMLRAERGEIGAALAAMGDSVNEGDQAGFIIASIAMRMMSAQIYGVLGDTERGVKLAQASLALSSADYPGEAQAGRAILAEFHLAHGEIAIAEDFLKDIPEVSSLSSSGPSGFYVARVRIEIALARGEAEQALGLADFLVEELEPVGIKMFLPDALWLKARALSAKGDLEQAVLELRRAIDIARSTLSRRILWQILAELAALEAARGRTPEAEAAYREAQAEVNYIAGQIPPELLPGFLRLPAVSRIMSGRASVDAD